MGVLGKAKHDPGTGRRRGVLSSHQKGNHHVGNLVVGDVNTILVSGGHQAAHDIEAFGATLLPSPLDRVHVDLSNGSLGAIASLVPGERSPVKDEVDRREAHVEVVVEVSERFVELITDFLALETVRSGEDGKLGHDSGDVHDARLALEKRVSLEVGLDLIADDGGVAAEGLGGERGFHELQRVGLI